MNAQTRHLTIYGATGFTGRQAARYLARALPPDAALALAGRNETKLRRLRAELGGDNIEVVLADSSDPLSIDAMVQATGVVLSTAGPFTLLGEPVISACARFGVDYADITGETVFIRRMIDRYQEQAQQSGAKIIPFCGFDSVPADLGVLLAVEHLRAREKACREVKGAYTLRGGINGGTLATMLLMAESDQARAMADPWLLNPRRQAETGGWSKQPDPRLPRFDRDLGGWLAPFVMAPINTRVVRRSAALAADWGEPYGPEFRYQEYWQLGRRWALPKALAATAVQVVTNQGLRLGPLRRLVQPLLPQPGSGPSEETRRQGFFSLRLVGIAGDGSQVLVRVTDQGDPGNEVTVKLLCEAGLCLARQREQLPGGAARAGFLTPATGLGLVLVDRLRAADMILEAQGNGRF